jgi:4'-phosphopantetheinyl transferase
VDLYWFEQTIADVPAQDDWLSPREQVQLRQFRFPKRRDDWRLGRWTAKQALSLFFDFIAVPSVLAKVEIIPALSGAPEAYFSGVPAPVSISLSHRASRAACCMAVVKAEIGCDVELVEPRSDLFIADYFTAEEQNSLAEFGGSQRWRLTALFWSAKESTLKLLREGLRGDPRIWSVKLPRTAIETSAWQTLEVRDSERTFYGWWRYVDGMVRTVVADHSSNPPIPLATTVDNPARGRVLPFRYERNSASRWDTPG